MPCAHSYRDDPSVPPFDDSAPVAVMDARCALCSWGARMVHRLDRSGTVRICPMQSPLGAALLRHYGMEPDNPESWLFLADGQPHGNLEAVIEAARRFGGWARIALALRLIPRAARRRLYIAVARNRTRLFGRASFCALPDPAFRRRLLE